MFIINKKKQVASCSAAINITECLCNAGFTGNDGRPCTGCAAGKFKDEVGSALCSTCTKAKTLRGLTKREGQQMSKQQKRKNRKDAKMK